VEETEVVVVEGAGEMEVDKALVRLFVTGSLDHLNRTFHLIQLLKNMERKVTSKVVTTSEI